MCALAAAVLTLAPACGNRDVEPRQPERLVRSVPSEHAGTPAPVKVKRVETPPPARPPQARRTPAPGDSVSVMQSYIRKVFGRHGNAAVRVAHCETGGTWNPKARGRRGEASLFQIRPELHSWRVKRVGGTSLWDWRTNVRVAYDLFLDSGWRPWTCRTAA